MVLYLQQMRGIDTKSKINSSNNNLYNVYRADENGVVSQYDVVATVNFSVNTGGSITNNGSLAFNYPTKIFFTGTTAELASGNYVFTLNNLSSGQQPTELYHIIYFKDTEHVIQNESGTQNLAIIELSNSSGSLDLVRAERVNAFIRTKTPNSGSFTHGIERTNSDPLSTGKYRLVRNNLAADYTFEFYYFQHTLCEFK